MPLKPFAGTIGVAPAERGLHSVVPPRRVGGNLDIHDLAAGTTLYPPVEVECALFSIGDAHAAQGDGEVCGTAIESMMEAEVTLDLVRGERLAFFRFTTSGPVTRHLDAKGYDATTGIGPALMTGARDAVSAMIDLLDRERGRSSEGAYLLCSVCGDLRISEIVDKPNWVVSFYMPRGADRHDLPGADDLAQPADDGRWPVRQGAPRARRGLPPRRPGAGARARCATCGSPTRIGRSASAPTSCRRACASA